MHKILDTPIIGPIKRLVANALPPRLLFIVKKRHYVSAVRSHWDSDSVPIKYLVKPGDSVLDIGANVGWYANHLSPLVGGSGKVYSIEPIPETFALLSAVVRELGLSNLELLNYAMSETDSSALMELPLWDNRTPNFYRASIVANTEATVGLRRYTVQTRSIDSLFLGLSGTISFIKCDVEGHELSVIKGAGKLLERHKPALLLEVSGNPDEPNSNWEELFHLLEASGYVPHWFDGLKLVRRSPGDARKASNYFFLRPSHLSDLTALIG